MPARKTILVEVPAEPERRIAPLAVSFEEAADLMSISRSTVRRLVDEGHLPVAKIYRTRKIRVVDIEAFLAVAAAEGVS